MTMASEQAWLDGLAAGREGRPLTANPRRAASDLGLDWLCGWREGERERFRTLDGPLDPDEAEA